MRNLDAHNFLKHAIAYLSLAELTFDRMGQEQHSAVAMQVFDLACKLQKQVSK